MASANLKKRVQCLEATVQVLSYLQARLVLTAEPIWTLWLTMNEENLFPAIPWISEVASYAPNTPFHRAFCTVAEQLPITKEEKSLLKEFATGCGKWDLEGQRRHFSVYTEQLENRLESAKAECRTKEKLYRVCGFASGAGVALLIM